ncbi:unnamed protein product [Meganyctiphanes norvegica]|uniref:30S ribosomal protein S18 n=1 Tax=Meganyctiphanes norvegica TaxID=48144 RepID=A0AAV2R6I7_MEGNR
MALRIINIRNLSPLLNISRTGPIINEILPKCISTSIPNFLKEIIVNESEKLTTVEGNYVTSARSQYLINIQDENTTCPLTALNLDIKHTDVLILSQFLRDDGCMLPRRVTGLSLYWQRRVAYLVAMAQKSGLMPNLTPSNSKKDPRKRFGSRKYNRYFDEKTLDAWEELDRRKYGN